MNLAVFLSGSGVAGFQPMVNQSSFLAATPQIMQQTGFYQTQLGSSSLQVHVCVVRNLFWCIRICARRMVFFLYTYRSFIRVDSNRQHQPATIKCPQCLARVLMCCHSNKWVPVVAVSGTT